MDPLTLTEGLLDRRVRSRRTRRRHRGLRVAAIVAATVVGVLWFVRGPASGEREVTSTHLLPLQAPELRIAALEGSGLPVPDAAVPLVPPSWVEGRIEPGQSLTAALISDGVPSDAIPPVVHAMGEVFDFRRSQPGHQYEAELDGDGVITALRYQTSPETIYEARSDGEGGYEAHRVHVELEVEVHAIAGSIDGSFIGAVVEAGEAEALAQRIVEVFQWDIDFSRDVRPGDAFRAIYERIYLDGEFLRYGNVLAVEYRGSRRSAAAYWFDEEDHEGYYDASGVPLERMFLAAPCRHRRISSRFDPDRVHPVLGVRRPHLGVDYAASTGTPVMAVADGTIAFVGERGANGNLVTIRHDHGYESGYAHLSRFARGLRRGDDVRQGQVIGFVGSTGLSTGPHLHFGLKRNGSYIDPLGDHDTRGPALSGRVLDDFQRRQRQLQAELDAILIADVQTAPDEIFDEEPAIGEDGEYIDGDYAVHDF